MFVVLMIACVTSLNAAEDAKLIEFWDDREPSSAMQINHDAWQQILTTYVDDEHQSGINRFNYSAVTPGDARKLRGYLDYMQQMEPRQLNSEEAKAYWINLFNALIVDKMVETFQTGSNRAINRVLTGGLRSGGRWSREIAEVAMQEISLNDIEHGILRPIWNDPRIHFAISACTLGGPNIQKIAFNGANNEELLEKAKVEFLQHPRAVRVQDGELILSSIFNWYASDFGDNRQEVLQYIRNNVDEKTQQDIRGFTRASYDYSWDLNALSR
jgi:hypothetical protein